MIRRSDNRSLGQAILLVDALSRLAGIIRKDASLKRLERNYNHLRLCLVPAIFTSLQELGMQPELLYPRRSRFAPILWKNIRLNISWKISPFRRSWFVHLLRYKGIAVANYSFIPKALQMNRSKSWKIQAFPYSNPVMHVSQCETFKTTFKRCSRIS